MKAIRARRPAILDEIPRDRDAVIEASAGTGKTYTLEHLVVEQVLAGTPIEKILVVTFTEQATTELRARIRGRIEALRALDADEDFGGAQPWTLDDTARARLSAALGSLDAATIDTIHGFCHRLLRELAFDAGRLFSETQVDAKEAFARAFVDALRTDLAVEQELRELLDAWLEESTLEDLQKLLAECASAHGELRPGFDHVGFLAAVRAVPTDAELAKQIVAAIARSSLHFKTKEKCTRLINALFAIERTNVSRLLRDLCPWLNENLQYLLETLAGLPQAKPLLEPLAALGPVTPTFEAVVAHSFLPVVKALLERRKREAGELDFDDMLGLVRDALRRNADPQRADGFAQRVRERYSVALIDEFQDTDEVQWEIFRTLFHQQPGCRLYVIGDPKQAIYGFRGADVQTYLQAKEEILVHGGKRVVLEENFRSTEPLIAAVNAILDDRAASPFFAGEIRYDRPMRCGRRELRLTDADGRAVHPVEVWHLHGSKLSAPRVLASLAARITEEIHRLLDSGVRLGGERLRAGDIYVIAQKKTEEQQVGRALRQSGLPVAFFKQGGLFETREASDVLDLLRAIAQPADAAACRRAWLTPFFGLSLEEIAGAGDVPPEHPLLSRLLSWRSLAESRHHERLFASVLDESGLLRRELLLAASERELTNYQHLFELLLAEVHRSPGSIDELARTLESYVRGSRKPPGTDTDLQRLESDRDAIQVMNLHKSKGLEAPVVFLFGALGGSLRGNVSIFHDGRRRCAWIGSKKPVEMLVNAETEQENRRLLYVGITRAKGRLYLPFVGELDPNEQAELSERWHGPQQSEFDIKGPYRWLNLRLAGMRAAGELTSERGFLRRFVRVAQIGEDDLPAPAPLRWDPDPALLEEPRPDLRPAELRRTHAGFFVTSYSRMAGARGEDEEQPVKPEIHATFVELPADHLARGADSGKFVHEAIEELSLEEVARAERFEAWSAAPSVATLFERLAHRHGINRRQIAHGKQLVWNALRTPLELPHGRLSGIASAERVLRELEFLYPIPERDHPLLSGATGAFSIERGCIKGFIDLVFEHQGRVYFADWKSDVLADYAAATLAAHVQAHYAIQERLYALALVRQLRLRSEREFEQRFGGSLYLFVRGMDGSGLGVHAARPGWREVVSWERALIDEQQWGISA